MLVTDGSASNRADRKGVVGSLIMAVFALIALGRWWLTHELFFLLLVMAEALASYFLWTRRKAQAEATRSQAIVSYISSALPLFYFSASIAPSLITLVADGLAIIGFLVVTLATIELGQRIGVSPARRGEVCRTGIYRWISHPMYLGYSVAQFGIVLLNPNNTPLYLLALCGFWMRAKVENKILQKHA